MHVVPPPGKSEGLGTRNKHNGETWKTLSNDHKDVFSARIFYALAGLPNFEAFDEGDDLDLDETEESTIPVPDVHPLNHEEEEIYRPIYHQLVDENRVKIAYADGLEISAAPKVVLKGLQSVRHINNKVNIIFPK